MRVSLIRHGMTEANEKRLYCGFTDLPLSEKGKQGILLLKETLVYPEAAVYITSGLSRTAETLWLLYNREPDLIIGEFREFNFGDFEMKSHDELENKLPYQNWINGKSADCPRGESRDAFESRVTAGLEKLAGVHSGPALIVCHGGVIAVIMETLLPGQKNFYEWQPDFGRGYTLDIAASPPSGAWTGELISKI